MIFIVKNEKGEPSWKLILEDKKTVTRRIKPLPVGKEFAVCPGRGKFAVCRAKVVSCMQHQQWIIRQVPSILEPYDAAKILNEEAQKEGFGSWGSLDKWFNARGQNISAMFRIEFEKLDTKVSNRK